MSTAKRLSSRQLARVVKELKPGQSHQIRNSKGQVFGTIGVPSDQSASDEQRPTQCSADSKRSTWLD